MIIDKLRSMENRENAAGMERFAIMAAKSFGIPTPDLKRSAAEIKKRSPDRHALAARIVEDRHLRRPCGGVHDRRSGKSDRATNGGMGKGL